MHVARRPVTSRPIIAEGVRVLRVSRTGPRSVEVIAAVLYREHGRGPMLEKALLVPVHLPRDRPLRDLRRVMLDGAFSRFDHHRRAERRGLLRNGS